MAYVLRYHPAVYSEDLPKIDKKIAKQLGRAIETRLTIYPEQYGVPLRRNLRGYWKLRVGDFRIVYQVVSKEIRILAICHRRKVYDIASGRG